mmetsp:Transcript_37785/g.59729  ORF Transcript_37785/g.59729 Transcript_37785/m.59729 type:complete len:335 (-) Transcript_37785:8-1012(-)
MRETSDFQSWWLGLKNSHSLRHRKRPGELRTHRRYLHRDGRLGLTKPDLEPVGEEDGAGDGRGHRHPVLPNAPQQPGGAGLLAHSHHACNHALLRLEHLIAHHIQRIGQHSTSHTCGHRNLGRLQQSGLLVLGIHRCQPQAHVILDNHGRHVLGRGLQDRSIQACEPALEALGGGQMPQHGDVGESGAGQLLAGFLQHDGRAHEGLVHSLSEARNGQGWKGGGQGSREALFAHPLGACVGAVEDGRARPSHAADDDQRTSPRRLHGFQVLLPISFSFHLVAGLANGCCLPQWEEGQGRHARGAEVVRGVCSGRRHLHVSSRIFLPKCVVVDSPS